MHAYNLFLAAAEHLEVSIENCVLVDDSIWDLLAAQRVLGIGVLSGGCGQGELERGAYRVYQDLDEVGVRVYIN